MERTVTDSRAFNRPLRWKDADAGDVFFNSMLFVQPFIVVVDPNVLWTSNPQDRKKTKQSHDFDPQKQLYPLSSF